MGRLKWRCSTVYDQAEYTGSQCKSGGAFLRFIVSDTEDMNSRTGMPEMKVNEDQKILSDIGKVNGMVTARISAGSVGTVEATVSLTVTEDMKGKALFYQTDIRTDGGTESETWQRLQYSSLQLRKMSLRRPLLMWHSLQI